MGFLMEHLNGPTSVLRRCAADCLGNLTSLPNFAHLLLESDLGAEPISSEFMQLLAARVADSAESPEVRQLACQTIVNLLHARPSGAVQTTAPELLVQCMPSDTGPEDAESAELAVLVLLALLHLPCTAFRCGYFRVLRCGPSRFQPIDTTQRGQGA